MNICQETGYQRGGQEAKEKQMDDSEMKYSFCNMQGIVCSIFSL